MFVFLFFSPVSVSEMLFLFLFVFVSVCFCFCFCSWESPLGILFVFSFPAIAARSAAGPRGSLGPPSPGDPSLHLTAGTRMFYARDSRNTDVLCTARANQGRRKQPAGLRNFRFFFDPRENIGNYTKIYVPIKMSRFLVITLMSWVITLMFWVIP